MLPLLSAFGRVVHAAVLLPLIRLLTPLPWHTVPPKVHRAERRARFGLRPPFFLLYGAGGVAVLPVHRGPPRRLVVRVFAPLVLVTGPGHHQPLGRNQEGRGPQDLAVRQRKSTTNYLNTDRSRNAPLRAPVGALLKSTAATASLHRLTRSTGHRMTIHYSSPQPR